MPKTHTKSASEEENRKATLLPLENDDDELARTRHASRSKYEPQTGTIERGHIYFFYRPKVQLKGARSLDEVQNFHMLLVPRPPQFSACGARNLKEGEDPDEMEVLTPGADAIPAREPLDQPKKHFRLITVGKKHLPNPKVGGPGKGRKEMFWATVTVVGDDLTSLEQGLGERTYETKTRGLRHQESARLLGRGAYAIVNNDPEVPSHRETHFGYHLSHPSELGEVQEAFGIEKAGSFVLQIKNPLAPATESGYVHGQSAVYGDEILHHVFGKGVKGRSPCGLHFTSCVTPELLDYEHAQLLLIAAKGGEEGLETSLGEGRGRALAELEEQEADESVETIFKELGMDASTFPPQQPVEEGEWI